MKDKVKVAAVQFDVKEFEEREKNIDYMLKKIEAMGSQEYDLIVFPEAVTGFVRDVGVFNQGFRSEYWKAADSIPGNLTKKIEKLTQEYGSHVVFGLAEKSRIPVEVYNTSVLVGPDGFIGKYHKMHIPYTEKKFFIPGGDPSVFKTKIGNIGMMICYDLCFPETARLLAIKGCEILTIIAQWGDNDDFGRREWDLLTRSRAMENRIHVVACNRTGPENEKPINKNHGSSRIISANGEVLALAKPDLIEATVNYTITNDELLSAKARGGSIFRDRIPYAYGELGKFESV